MKASLTLLYLFLISIFSFNAFCTESFPQESKYTYVYKLTTAEAQYFVNHKSKKVEFKSQYLHSLVDSFLTEKSFNHSLLSGNYLFLSVHNNELVYEMHNFSSLQLIVLKQYKKVSLRIIDSSGIALNNVSVKLNNRRLKFDKSLNAYVLNANPSNAIIEVTTENENAFFELKKNTDNDDYSDESWSSLILSGSITYVVQPSIFILSLPFDLVKSLYYWHFTGSAYGLFKPFIDIYNFLNDEYTAPWIDKCLEGVGYEQDFNKGYIVFNKPKYKLGDTVMFKAFVTDKKGNAINEEAIVKLWGNKAIELTKLKPYRAGAYTYQFILKDSLGLKLDRDYTVGLFDTKYNSLISSRFRLEAYELKTAKFTIKPEKEEHYRHVPAILTCSGIDDNGLNLLGASVELTVIPVSLSNPITKFVSLSDTLWTHKQMLQPNKLTQIEIPDSIFPDADVLYQVKAIFYTSDYEKHYSSCNLRFTPSCNKVEYKIKRDSIYFTYSHNGTSQPKKQVKLTPIDTDDNDFVSTTLNLPAAVKINPFVKEYEFEADSLDYTIEMEKAKCELTINANKTEDSLFVQIFNPTKIAFNYFLYNDKKLIKSGNNTEMPLALAASGNKMFHIVLSYIWAGKAEVLQQAVAFRDKQLNIKLTHPEVCFPGQKISITALVTDANNKPVENADLTVYANTVKFNDRLPALPYFGKQYTYENLPLIDYSESTKIESIKKNTTLNYSYWNPKFHLNQLQYYKLLHPENKLFECIAKTKDSGAWITPYLVRNGRVLPVEIVYLNSIPVWFAKASATRPYCIPIIPSEGNSITIRSTDCEVSFFVDAKVGTAMVVSAEADKKNPAIEYKTCSPKYSAYEMELLNKYLIEVITDKQKSHSYIWQGNNVFQTSDLSAIQYNYYSGYQNHSFQRNIVGPIYNGMFGFSSIGQFKTATEMEEGYNYLFAPNKVKLTSQKIVSNSSLVFHTPSIQFNTQPLTMDSIKLLWDDYANKMQFNIEAAYNQNNRFNPNFEYRNDRLYSNFEHKTTGCNLSVTLKKKKTTQSIKNIVLLNIETGAVDYYNGNRTMFNKMASGYYQLAFLFNNNNYILTDTFLLPAKGMAALTIDSTFIIHNADAFSLYHNQRIRDILKLRFEPKPIPTENIDSLTNRSYTISNKVKIGVKGKIMGRVIDEKDGFPLIGVSISINGTSRGTVTNYDGYFELPVDEDALNIEVNYIGYIAQTLKVKNGKSYTILLMEDVLNLDEVVVVGYGVQKKSFLSGIVSGLKTENLVFSAPEVVDSVKIDEPNFSDFNMDDAKEEVFGIDDENGPTQLPTLIETTTKPNKLQKMTDNEALMNELQSQHRTRSRFSDYAFWQPCLSTNKQGLATFHVTLPDDITAWNVFALAATDNKQNAGVQSSISSFKPVSAILPVPHFLVQGDNISIKGKVQNYIGDTLTVRTQFTLNNIKQPEQHKQIRYSAFDSLLFEVNQADTFKLNYSLQLANGYTDEEAKRIPVIKAGTKESIGQFWAIKRDTAFTFLPIAKGDSLIVHAESDVLNIVLSETDKLYHYQYLCNEQLASKLKALIFEKRICDKIKNSFKHAKDINIIINKLQKNQNSNQLWSWWGNSPYSVYWISLHVVESLLMAQESGFAIELNKDALQNYLFALMRTTISTDDQLRIAQIIRRISTNSAFVDAVMKIKMSAKANFSTQMEYQYVRSLAKMSVNIDSLYAMHHTSLMGNMYWGSSNLSCTNSVVSEDLWASLMMYKMLQMKGENKDKCASIRDWFLEKRRDGGWLNTYASAAILETLLPDMLNDNILNNPPSLTLTVNGVKTDICSYPYHKSFKNTDKIIIETKGKAPLYLSAYSTLFNAKPVMIDKDFQIETSFVSAKAQKAVGNSIRLHVRINVKRTTDYVMIEVPIPAGCSYENKPQFGFVDHCEYFEEKVSLFSSHLNQGVYEFDVPLLARFSGKFIINPAKAEHMYFPVFKGRTGMGMLEIK